jgi:selenocysteine-specific elongation factor
MLTRDATIRLYPSGDSVRVRTLQAHGHAVDRIEAGERAAIALAGVDLSRVGRGAVLVSGEAWRATTVLRADVAMLDDAPRAISPRSHLRLHLGTSEVGARMVAAGGVLSPGDARPVRIVVDEPIISRAGDRFVLRGGSPVITIGGGIITDPMAPARARAWERGATSPAGSIEHFLREAGSAGVELSELPIRLGITRAQLDELLASAELWRVEDRVFSAAARDAIAEQVLATLAEHHGAQPLSTGAPRQWLRTRIRAAESVVNVVVDELVRDGRLAVAQGEVRLATFAPRLTGFQRTMANDVLGRLATAGNEPPTIEELAIAAHVEVAELGSVCRVLAREGELVAVETNRYYLPNSVMDLTRRLEVGMDAASDYGPADLRDLLVLTRKFLIPFLEYCDREGYTIRNELGRRRRGTKMAT